jgi:hypothetical protein
MYKYCCNISDKNMMNEIIWLTKADESVRKKIKIKLLSSFTWQAINEKMYTKNSNVKLKQKKTKLHLLQKMPKFMLSELK